LFVENPSTLIKIIFIAATASPDKGLFEVISIEKEVACGAEILLRTF
jgi:hypothetical protein